MGKWDHLFKSNPPFEMVVEESGKYKPRCYESHPILKLGKGRLYGGSASHPVKKADIYVALQSGSSASISSDPWDEQTTIEIHYSIPDGGIPGNVPRFLKMIEWLCNQLQDGKKVHVGCIGGHGRTGMILSAIVATMLKKKDAIQYVREHYCPKAVESYLQVAFLMEHFGVSKVEGSKDHLFKDLDSGRDLRAVNGHKSSKTNVPTTQALMPIHRPKSSQKVTVRPDVMPEGVTSQTKTYPPMSSPRSLWNKKVH